MSATGVQIALGTVQFGMAYGIAGRGEPVPPSEVRDILALAWKSGVQMLDTAPVYGDIEERLSDLLGDHSCNVVSKIPPVRPGAAPDEAARSVRDSVALSRRRLGARLSAILFHRAADLLGPLGDLIWRVAVEALRDTDVKLGASCYSPREAFLLQQRFPLALVQTPGNALDQRLHSDPPPAECEVHVRSVFLQGLLLMSPEEAAARVPAAKAAYARWSHWRREHDLTALEAALGVAKAFPSARYCVVGVDRCVQLAEILAAWERVAPIHAPTLAVDDESVIDPRRW